MTLCSWEGNRRSGVALAMRHRLSGLSTYGLNDLDREMSIPPTLRRTRPALPYLYLSLRKVVVLSVELKKDSGRCVLCWRAKLESLSADFSETTERPLRETA